MADNSNVFSISGLNRNTKISGLHAHRSENTSIYFDYSQIRVAPQFVSIMQAEVTSVGINYSKNTTLTFPRPQHPSGIAASGYPLFSLSKNSFSVTNAGSNYSIGDSFPIIFNNFLVGAFSVVSTGTSGSISDYSVFSLPLDLKSGMMPSLDMSRNSTASVSSNDRYTISSVLLTFPGYGYQTLNRTDGTAINYSPAISNAGSSGPSGLTIKSSLDPYVLQYTEDDPRIKSPEINKFDEVKLDRNRNHYFIANNFSLGDFF
jgi:hypothetical protein